MEENKLWIIEGLMIGFLTIQIAMPFFYHSYFSLQKCSPEIAAKSNMYLFVFTLSGVISFASCLYLKREKTAILELLIFMVGMAVVLSESLCI